MGHIGTLRVASSFKNVHAIMHAPLGDDYFNVMRSMLERERDFTPVTSSIVQEDLQNFVDRATAESEANVILADVNHYRVNELQAADRTLEQIVRFCLEKAVRNKTLDTEKTSKPSVNLLGFFTLGFHHTH